MSNRTVVVAILAGVLLLALAAGWQITPTVRRARESARDRAQAQQRDGVPATRGFWDKRRHERKRADADLLERAKRIFRLATASDRLESATPQDKAAAWQRYLAVFGSTGHETGTARERVAHWRSVRPSAAAPAPAAVEGQLPPGFAPAFMLPTGAKDQHGNPVVTRGHDAPSADDMRKPAKRDRSVSPEVPSPKTGWPYEVWLKAPRVEFVLIPSGEFMMGSPKTERGRSDNEGPVHSVRITRPFYLAKYELAQLQYEAITGGNPSMYKGPKRPVEQMSWEDAATCCTVLAEWTGIEVRLPTEAEWEYACRAGTRTRFSFGDDPEYSQLREHAWYGADGDQTHPVGRKKPNPWGLYDMHGNVWEWCLDGGRTYGIGPQTDPRGPEAEGRVARGGAWSLHARRARCAFRIAVDHTRPCHLVGFRVMCLSPDSRSR